MILYAWSSGAVEGHLLAGAEQAKNRRWLATDRKGKKKIWETQARVGNPHP